MEFEKTVKEILEKYDHIKSENWESICYALFLEYRYEKSLVEKFLTQLKMRDVF
jgi:hypothetical protein